MKRRNILISIFVFGVVCLGGYFLYDKYDRLLKSTQAGLVFGKTYGKQVKQSDCLVGIPIKYRACNDVDCELSARGFINGCMRTAETDNFCTDLPKSKQTKKSIQWVTEKCDGFNLSNTKCSKYMHEFVSFCTEQTENRKRPNMERFQDGFNRGLTRS